MVLAFYREKCRVVLLGEVTFAKLLDVGGKVFY